MGERALGRDGLGQDDRLALGSLGPKVVELNAAEFADWHHSFADFHQRPELALAMLPYVYFHDDASSTTGEPSGPTISAPNGTAASPPASQPPQGELRAKPSESASSKNSSGGVLRAGEVLHDRPIERAAPRSKIEMWLEP